MASCDLAQWSTWHVYNNIYIGTLNTIQSILNTKMSCVVHTYIHTSIGFIRRQCGPIFYNKIWLLRINVVHTIWRTWCSGWICSLSIFIFFNFHVLWKQLQICWSCDVDLDGHWTWGGGVIWTFTKGQRIKAWLWRITYSFKLPKIWGKEQWI